MEFLIQRFVWRRRIGQPEESMRRRTAARIPVSKCLLEGKIVRFEFLLLISFYSDFLTVVTELPSVPKVEMARSGGEMESTIWWFEKAGKSQISHGYDWCCESSVCRCVSFDSRFSTISTRIALPERRVTSNTTIHCPWTKRIRGNSILMTPNWRHASSKMWRERKFLCYSLLHLFEKALFQIPRTRILPVAKRTGDDDRHSVLVWPGESSHSL